MTVKYFLIQYLKFLFKYIFRSIKNPKFLKGIVHPKIVILSYFYSPRSCSIQTWLTFILLQKIIKKYFEEVWKLKPETETSPLPVPCSVVWTMGLHREYTYFSAPKYVIGSCVKLPCEPNCSFESVFFKGLIKQVHRSEWCIFKKSLSSNLKITPLILYFFLGWQSFYHISHFIHEDFACEVAERPVWNI